MGNNNLSDGVSFVALREIKFLKEISHPNIIELIDTFVHQSSVYLVFEFMETDLEAMIKDPDIVLAVSDIKSILIMILRAVSYCHKHWILHRDLKPNNLLIDRKGCVKLGDFGLARMYGSPNFNLTHLVVTRWYRAPELLFGSRSYSYGIDIWAVGCIFAELMLRTPYLPGETDIDQLSKIFAALGTPTEENWPGMKLLPNYVEFRFTPKPPLKQLFTAATDDALDLLSKMLTFNPPSRITADQALTHRYFTTGPEPAPPEKLKLPKNTNTKPEQRNGRRKFNAEDLEIGGKSVRRKLNLEKN